MDGLKKRLNEAKGKCVNKLPHILWTYRTTPKRSTRETSFSMTYGSEVVIPMENGFPTLRFDQFLGNSNEQILSLDLDLAEERWEVVVVRLAQYQQRLRQGFEKGVKTRVFILGDYVLHRVDGSKKNISWGKLAPS